jgi:apolipoprotein N-acyltransferase
MIDARGRVMARLTLDEAGALDSRLPPPERRPTPYARFGDAPYFALFAMLIATLFATRKINHTHGC